MLKEFQDVEKEFNNCGNIQLRPSDIISSHPMPEWNTEKKTEGPVLLWASGYKLLNEHKV